jgi:DNA-binding transcriptional LysR family regulator
MQKRKTVPAPSPRVGLLPDRFVEEDVQAGRLVKLPLETPPLSGADVNVVLTRASARTAKVRTFLDLLDAEVAGGRRARP